MKTILKQTRESKGLLMREVAAELNIDAALVSKWESGSRKPTKEQIIKLCQVLNLDTEKMLIEWMSEMIIYEIGNDDLAFKALLAAEEKLKYSKSVISTSAPNEKLSIMLKEIDQLKMELNNYRHMDSYRIAQALELEYTFESNRIEGNTLTLKETDLVINEGITISGKTMREHLEAINHQEAVNYLKDLVQKKTDIRERDLLNLHNLILRGIDSEYAGKYRHVQVMIKGSRHMPPPPYLVAKQMEEVFLWYELNKNKIHPLLLAAEMSEKIVTIHPFVDGNGRTSRLWMNLLLLKHGYVIANIKGDHTSRLMYYDVLEKAQADQNKTPYFDFIVQTELDALKRYLSILKP